MSPQDIVLPIKLIIPLLLFYILILVKNLIKIGFEANIGRIFLWDLFFAFWGWFNEIHSILWSLICVEVIIGFENYFDIIGEDKI